MAEKINTNTKIKFMKNDIIAIVLMITGVALCCYVFFYWFNHPGFTFMEIFLETWWMITGGFISWKLGESFLEE